MDLVRCGATRREKSRVPDTGYYPDAVLPYEARRRVDESADSTTREEVGSKNNKDEDRRVQQAPPREPDGIIRLVQVHHRRSKVCPDTNPCH